MPLQGLQKVGKASHMEVRMKYVYMEADWNLNL